MTRKEYMSLPFSEDAVRFEQHDAYYRQFVTEYEVGRVAAKFGDRIMISDDEHLNDIPLHEWDIVQLSWDCQNLLKQAGETTTAATRVCVLKAAARMFKEA